MSQHTPGPWYVGGGGIDVFARDGHRLIAACAALSVEGMGLQNARLIAAAPMLLEALEQMLNLADRYTGVGLKEVDAARAAIRAAKGDA